MRDTCPFDLAQGGRVERGEEDCRQVIAGTDEGDGGEGGENHARRNYSRDSPASLHPISNTSG